MAKRGLEIASRRFHEIASARGGGFEQKKRCPCSQRSAVTPSWPEEQRRSLNSSTCSTLVTAPSSHPLCLLPHHQIEHEQLILSKMLRTALNRSTAPAFTAFEAGSRTLAAASVRSKHTLPDLSYDYGALEPAISGQIMELHHTKHHQTYLNGLNTAEEQLSEALHKKDVKSAIALQKAINFNGGGHINHTLFWENLAPKKQGGGELSSGVLKDAIDRDFGGLDGLKQKFNAQIAAIQGSGWGWLGYNPQTKKLDIVTTANQDPLLCKYHIECRCM